MRDCRRVGVGRMEIDFKQLATGTRFEQLVRDVLVTLDYPVVWSGVGPDDGKDLIVEEAGHVLLGKKPRRWLVSCKHNAHSDTSVSFADLTSSGGITSLVRDVHAVDAFLVVCSTQVSAGCMRQLDAIESNDRIPITVWDSATFSRLAGNPRVYALLQEYLPNMEELNQLKVFRTTEPNRFVIVGRGYFLIVDERNESVLSFQLDSVRDHLERLQKIQLRQGASVHIRPRYVFFDNKHGAARYETDVLVDIGFDLVEAERIRYEVENELNHPSWTTSSYSDGQSTDHEVKVQRASFANDGFDKDHYRYYPRYT